MAGTDPLIDLPEKFDSRAAANAEYHRIMQGAAAFQQMLNMHVVASATRSDPVERAASLDKAITSALRMVDQFRRARDVLMAVSPLVKPPEPTAIAQRFAGTFKPRRF